MHLRFRIHSAFICSFALILYSILQVHATGECRPATWKNTATQSGGVNSLGSLSKTADSSTSTRDSIVNRRYTPPGEINCRYSSTTTSNVNCYTCCQMAKKYKITIEAFFILNPNLTRDCKNIKPNTEYCVAGRKSHISLYY